MSGVVISYARHDQAVAKELAKHLQSLGFPVWWDAELLGSDDFHDVIKAEFTKARAVIVIWSETAVKSHFVRDEARYALQYKKLVATKAPALKIDSIPWGFQGQHTEDIHNRDKIVRAIEKLGAQRQPAQPTVDTAQATEELATQARVTRTAASPPYGRDSKLSALVSGLTLRLPDFLTIRSGQWAAIGAALTYLLIGVVSYWVVKPHSDAVVVSVGRTVDYVALSVWVAVNFGVIVFAWRHFYRFIEQRLFAAGFILALAIGFQTLLVCVLTTHFILYRDVEEVFFDYLPWNEPGVWVIPIVSLIYALFRMWKAR